MAREAMTQDSILTKEDIGFDIKVTWLSIAKMFYPLAEEHSITVNSGFVLLNISTDKGTPATKIAPLLGMEPRSLTRMLKQLEAEKLIVRRPDPEDKRSVRIFLTEAGLEKKRIARAQVMQFNEKVHAAVSGKDLKTFFDVLQKIHEITLKHK